MRYIPIGCIRKDMVLGKSILGTDGQLLLKKGTAITDKYIETIKKFGLPGIYVSDSISDDIEIEGIISDELRRKTVNGIKNMFIALEENDEKARVKHMDDLQSMVNTMLDEIFINKEIMINMMDLKFFDEYTYQHSVNVSILAMVMGLTLNYKREEIFKLGLSALLHDIGKVFIRKEILNKPTKLDEDEFEEMKCHVTLGYEYLRNKSGVPLIACRGALDHHEKYDGTGYPNGKKGNDISLFGRIISIVDVYDALTSERPYRKALLPSEAVEYLMGGTSTYFDFELVEVFTRRVAAYPLGTCIRLSNGYTGIVVENHVYTALRPTVRILQIDDKDVEPFTINLGSDRDYLNVIIEAIVNI